MKAPYFTGSALESVARCALLKFDVEYMNRQPAPIPIEYIIENVYGLTLDFRHLTNNSRLLGKTIFDDGVTPYYNTDTGRYEFIKVKAGTMMLETKLADEGVFGRLRFTEAHELAHWLLHQKLYAGTHETAAFLSSDQDSITEYQANIVASHLLMPKCLVKRAFFALRGLDADDVTQELAGTFAVSREAMSYRLKDLKLTI